MSCWPALAPVFAALVEHPRVLAICDAFLAPNYLLTAAQAICIHPGEAAQGVYYDDSSRSSGIDSDAMLPGLVRIMWLPAWRRKVHPRRSKARRAS